MGSAQGALGGTAGQLSAVLAGEPGLLVRRHPKAGPGPARPAVSSFLLSTILEILEYEANAVTYSTIHPEHIRSILDEAGVDFQRLQEPYPFPGGRFCHTCLDPETNILYVYGEARKDCPADLKIFQPEEDDED